MREPNALDAAAGLAGDLVYAVCCLVIIGTPFVLWIMTPSGMQ